MFSHPFAMPRDVKIRKAWWGAHYVSLVCDQAGLLFQESPSQGDVYSFDGQLWIKSGLSVSVQVKCTARRVVRQRSYRIKPAWRKNWDRLDLPGYFVVVTVPSDVTDDWLEHAEDPAATLARSAAFWTRIDPLDPNQTDITVLASQRLTVDTFKEWADDLQFAKQGFRGGI